MRLSPQYKAAFMRGGYHALYIVGPPYRVRLDRIGLEPHGIGHNAPEIWPQRLIISADTTAKPIQRVDAEQWGIDVFLLARVWCRSQGDALLLMADYRALKSGDLRKQWVDGGVPVDRDHLDFELVCIAKDRGISAWADDHLMDELDNIVFAPRGMRGNGITARA